MDEDELRELAGQWAQRVFADWPIEDLTDVEKVVRQAVEVVVEVLADLLPYMGEESRARVDGIVREHLEEFRRGVARTVAEEAGDGEAKA